MLVCINYGTPDWKKAQKLNSKSAIKRGKADSVISYGPQDIDTNFLKKNESIFSQKIGGGYWLWKPYIIVKTLETLSDGDYLCYSDSGSFFTNKISLLIQSMKSAETDIMPFSLTYKESVYTKRDAFVLMNCDSTEFTDTPQICATYLLIKKSPYSMKFCKEWLSLCEDSRLLTNDSNVMGKENYPDFIAHRNDQSILSLLCKKEKLPVFRDPSQYGLDFKSFSKGVVGRSSYPQVFNSHRSKRACFYFQIESKFYNFIYNSLKKNYNFLKRVFSYVRKNKK
jgi:hypothetical protein